MSATANEGTAPVDSDADWRAHTAKWRVEYATELVKWAERDEKDRDHYAKEAVYYAKRAKVEAATSRRQKRIGEAFAASAEATRKLLVALQSEDDRALDLADARAKVARAEVIRVLEEGSRL